MYTRVTNDTKCKLCTESTSPNLKQVTTLTVGGEMHILKYCVGSAGSINAQKRLL